VTKPHGDRDGEAGGVGVLTPHNSTEAAAQVRRSRRMNPGMVVIADIGPDALLSERDGADADHGFSAFRRSPAIPRGRGQEELVGILPTGLLRFAIRIRARKISELMSMKTTRHGARSVSQARRRG